MFDSNPGGHVAPDPIIRPSRVAAELGISLTALERLRRTDVTFPVARKLGARASDWPRSEIMAWRNCRPAADAAAPPKVA